MSIELFIRCKMCSELFPKKGKRVYCSTDCSEQANLNRSRMRGLTLHLALQARNVQMERPTRAVKGIWNGFGKWAKMYDRCEECRMTLYKHQGNGLCRLCFGRLTHRVRTERDKEIMRRGVAERRIKAKQESLYWLEKLESGELDSQKVTIIKENLDDLKSKLKEKRYSEFGAEKYKSESYPHYWV